MPASAPTALAQPDVAENLAQYGLAAFRAWLLEEARLYAIELAAPAAAEIPKPSRRKR